MTDTPLSDETCRTGQRAAILSTCWKVISSQTFVNGLLLLYLTSLHFSGATVMVLLSLASVLLGALWIPGAHIADRRGRRKTALLGIAICGAGFALLPLAGFLPESARTETLILLALGVSLFGVGHALQMGGWWPLLAAITHEETRGRFLGQLRISWQVVSLVFAAIVAALLPADTPILGLQFALTLSALTILPWGLYYARIPDPEGARPGTEPFVRAFRETIRAPGQMSFCAYVFIIQFFTGCAPMLFSLTEKNALNLGDGTVVFLANLTLAGSLAGYWLGGRAVDRFGPKPVFLVCHFGYGLAMLAFLLRDASAWPSVPVLGVVHFAFGLPFAGSSIAITTEMLNLAPAEHRSLSTALCSSLSSIGVASAGFLSAGALRLGMFAPTWTMLGHPRSAYDAALLLCSVMIVVMTITLGLVPSVLGKVREFPRALS